MNSQTAGSAGMKRTYRVSYYVLRNYLGHSWRVFAGAPHHYNAPIQTPCSLMGCQSA
jgi:hypothetical protein